MSSLSAALAGCVCVFGTDDIETKSNPKFCNRPSALVSNSIGLDLRVSEGLKRRSVIPHKGSGRYTSNCSALVEPHNLHHHSMKWLVHVVAPLISVVIFTLLPPVKNAINTTRK